MMIPPDKIYFLYSFKGKEVTSKVLPQQSAKMFQPLRLNIPNFKEYATYQKAVNVISS